MVSCYRSLLSYQQGLLLCRHPGKSSGKEEKVGKPMDIAKLVLEYIKALAWPITALILAAIFHAPLKEILARLRKAVLPGGVSIELQDEIQKAKELSRQVEAAPTPSDRPRTPMIPLTEANARLLSLGLQPVSSGLDMSYYREIAQTDPTLALAGLRIEIEILVKNIAAGFKVEHKKVEPVSSLLRRLLDHGAITHEQAELARKILSICNKAIHGQTVSQEEAQEVIDAAAVIARDFLAWLSWGFDDNWRPKSLGAPS